MGGDVVACDVVVVNAVVVVDDMTCDVAFVVAEAPCGFEVVVVEHTDVNDKALVVVVVVGDIEAPPFLVRFLF